MKIGIIGTGMVGSAVAFSITSEGLADKLILIDTDKLRATAEAMDISHAAPFSLGTLITSGDYPDLKGSDIVIITAGANQKAGETRLDLLSKNVAIFKQIIPEVTKYAAGAMLLIATNPVDVMTEITLKLSGFPQNRVIGTGTVLDTARFRSILGRYLCISPKSIHANVIGEHGDSEVLLMSGAVAGTTPVEQIAKQLNLPLDERIKNKIDDEVRNAAYAIIEGKGATYYGIAAATQYIVKAILSDNHTILNISSHQDICLKIPTDTCFSMPSVISNKGVETTLTPVMNEHEQKALKKSADKLKEYTLKALEMI
jgi:L-lactate dehydrogenase